MTFNKADFFLSLFLFLAIFYAMIGCSFGEGNNVEELPVIYKKAGFYNYERDAFVNTSSTGFNAISLYTETYALLAQVTGLQLFKYIYFLSHFAVLICLYLAYRKILKSLSKKPVSEYLVLFAVFGLVFLDRVLHLMPNGRMLFWPYFDPEFLVYPFLFGSIAFFINHQHNKSAVLLFIATLIHPLYSLPIAGTYIVSVLILEFNKNVILTISKYLFSVIPFSLILFLATKAKQVEIYDASLLHEFVRAPHHLIIPTLTSGNQTSYVRFLEVTGLFIALSIVLNAYRLNIKLSLKAFSKKLIQHKNTPIAYLYSLIFVLIIGLILTSLIASFTRIDLIVQLTPFRIGLVIVALAFLHLVNASKPLFSFIKWQKYYPIILVTSSFFFLLILFLRTMNAPQDEAKIITSDWIKNNTNSNSLFLNYSDLDVRTSCGRSDYFQFKTIPLTNPAQVEWYKRLLVYYNLENDFKGTEYKEIGELIRNDQHQINLQEVINNTKKINVDYLLVSKPNQNKLSTINLTPIFNAERYFIYDLKNVIIE